MIGKEVDEAYYEKVLSIQLQPELDKKNLHIVFSPEHGTANIPVKESIYKSRISIYCSKAEQCSPDS